MEKYFQEHVDKGEILEEGSMFSFFMPEKGKGKLSDVEKLLEQQKININKIRREIANFSKNKHIATRISQRKKNPTDIYVPSNFKAKKTSKTSKSKK